MRKPRLRHLRVLVPLLLERGNHLLLAFFWMMMRPVRPTYRRP